MQLPPLITLTTDFGTSDTYVGVMKAVIFTICPSARVVDLTHQIAPQNVLEAGARMEAALAYCPKGTIHLAVVDPGVGGDRNAVIVRTANCQFVAPDNGLLTLPLADEPTVDVFVLDDRVKPFLPNPISATFHGRDLFAPVAAHLARGVDAADLGRAAQRSDLIVSTVPQAEFTVAGGFLHAAIPVLFVDHFGNMITALRPHDIESVGGVGTGPPVQPEDAELAIGELSWRGIGTSFVSVVPGEPVAYWGSGGRLEIAIRNGNAAARMGAGTGDIVRLRLAIR